MTSFEDLPLQRALEKSLADYHPDTVNPQYLAGQTQADGETTESSETDPTSNGLLPQASQSPPRYSIDDCIRDISDRQSLDMPRLWDPEGDTFIFIDPPGKQPEQSDADYEHYSRRLSKPFLMKSEKLQNASPMFKDLLGATQQFRTIRRRGLVYKLPPFVKYVLDLTPPAEGEDAVYLTATLCCSEGVRFWSEAADVWQVSDSMVKGRDEFSATQFIPSAADGAPLEYSPIRHRCAIERVLAAIQGSAYSLNSAVKVWTTTVVAEYFGLTSQSCTELVDSIVTWLRAEPNSHFIEVNPEVTLRIAAAFQNEDLARDAFAILVGEEALDSLVAVIDRQYSTYGRKKDDLPETWLQAIEYASKSFIDRNVRDFETLTQEHHMSWFDKLPSVQHLDSFTDPELKRLASELKPRLKQYIAAQVGDVVAARYTISEGGFGSNKAAHILPRHTELTAANSLDKQCRIFSRLFWSKLRHDSRAQPKEGRGTENVDIERGQSVIYPGFGVAKARKIVNKGQRHLESLERISEHMRDNVEGLQKIDTVMQDVVGTEAAADARQPVAGSCQGSIIKTEDDRNMWDELCDEYPLLRNENTDRKLSSQGRAAEEVKKESSQIEEKNDLSDLRLPPAQEEIEEEEWPLSQSMSWDEAGSIRVHEGRLKKVLPNPDIKKTESVSMQDVPSSEPLEENHTPSRATFFKLESFFAEVAFYLIQVCDNKLAAADEITRQYPFYPELPGTLTCLSDSEWKYLPMWAGGYDDGTGAVFSDDPTEAMPDAGFSTPGPSIHTGNSTYSSASSNGDFDMLSDAGSSNSFNTSTVVEDGQSDQLIRKKTYAASSLTSSTDDDSIVDVGAEDEEAKATREVAALEASQAAEEAARREQQAEPVEDICYDDMFAGDDDDGEEEEEEEEDDDYDSDVTERGDDFEDLAGDNSFDLALRSKGTLPLGGTAGWT